MGRRIGKSRLSLAATLAVMTLSACSAQPAAEASTAANTPAAMAAHPVSGLAVIPLTVVGADGKHVFKVEVADTAESQRQGLMFRTELADDEGMIFPYDGTTAQSFWMKNTPIPLDIIYIGPDGRVSNIAANTTPYSLDPVYSVGPVLGVLELRGGRAAELGIEPGDKVDW